MKFGRKLVLVLCALLALAGTGSTASPSAAASSDYVPADFRELSVQVLLPNHEPASHTTVTLRSMSRNMLRDFSGYHLEPVITDANGYATLKYATRIDSPKGKPYGFSVLPLYATVEPATDHAGAIVKLDEVSSAKRLTIQIVDGYELRGKIQTEDGDPVSSVTAMINHDLQAESHTGYGGEIWQRRTVTDTEGNFVFTHVNPSTVTITPGLKSSYWSKTTINGSTIHDCIDRFQPEWNNSENEVTIVTSPSPAKVYQGIAVDQNGKPVSGADVAIGYSHHRKDVTWSDSHISTETKTLPDGTWTLAVPTKWVNWGQIQYPGNPASDSPKERQKLSGGIDLSVTAPQVVRLAPVEFDR